jgi:hypothetical protein
VSAITLVDLGKLKRLMIKKDLYTPLFDDILYQNQTKLLKSMEVKMGILNAIRGVPTLTQDQLAKTPLYLLMIDNFEYQKHHLSE